jgi:magnesium transporter
MSALRRNIIFLQTSLKPARAIFRNLENIVESEEDPEKDIHWGDIADFIGKILDMAEDYQELIEGIYSSIDTMLTYRTNSIMKTLTMISVIMLPLSLITGFYGMNIELPFADLKPAGIYIGGFMGIVAIAMLLYFKARKF